MKRSKVKFYNCVILSSIISKLLRFLVKFKHYRKVKGHGIQTFVYCRDLEEKFSLMNFV